VTGPARPTPRAWLMWGVSAFLFLFAFFHRAAPGVFAKELMQTFGATGTLIGILSATYYYSYAGLMIPAGVLLDRLGARRVVATGGLVMGGGTLMMALASGFPLLFAGRFLVGAGASVMFVGALKIAAAWFPAAYFATLSATTAAIGVLGGLVATAPMAGLAAGLGWRGAFVTVGVVTLVGAVACVALVRDRPPVADPMGAASPPGWAAVLGGLGRVLGNWHTWPPFLGFFFLYSATNNLIFWIVPCLRDVYGLGMTDAALYATAPSLALLVAGPLTGFVSDRVLRRRRLPYTVLTGLQFVGWTVFVLTLGRLPLGGLYALLFGMGLVGAAFVLTWPLGREVNPPALAGIAVAAVNLGGFVGAAVTQGPLGAILDAHWAGVTLAGARVYPVEAYRASFGASAVLVLCACLVSLFFRETRGENVYVDARRRPLA
jgi:MFS family permease